MDTATTEIYTLSLHDALPISSNDVHIENNLVVDYEWHGWGCIDSPYHRDRASPSFEKAGLIGDCSLKNRSEEHTSELQSHVNLVCRLLLEKKKKNNINYTHTT